MINTKPSLVPYRKFVTFFVSIYRFGLLQMPLESISKACVMHEYLMNLRSAMSPALNGSSAMRRFECSNAIEIRDGITFDFYSGLPHVSFSMPPDPLVSHVH